MSVDPILAIADKLNARMRREFLAAVEKLRTQLDLDQIVSDVLAGRASTAALAFDQLDDDLRDAATVVVDAFQKAGQSAALSMSGRLRTSMAFDITNPYAVEAARALAARLVTNISNETRLAIQNIITRAFEEGLTRRDTSLLLRPLIGLTNRDAQAVLNFRAQLEALGLRADLVLKRTQAYAAKKLRQRAESIARYELMAASNGGQRALWVQAVRRGLLDHNAKRRWLVGPEIDENAPCRRCRAMDDQVVGLHEMFRSAYDIAPGPPLHPRCRCTEVLVIRRAA